jgi:hypothetical protein
MREVHQRVAWGQPHTVSSDEQENDNKGGEQNE